MNVLANSKKEQKPKKKKDREYWKKYNQKPVRKEYQRKLMAQKRVRKKVEQRVQQVMANLEKCRVEHQYFPRSWLKKFLLGENEQFWQVFEKILIQNRLQKEFRLPLTLRAVRKWKEEKEQANKPLPLYEFYYELNSNRLWFQNQEIPRKEINERGKQIFFCSPQIYLEITRKEGRWLLVGCQERQGEDIYYYRSYFSSQAKNLIVISFYPRDRVAKISSEKIIWFR